MKTHFSAKLPITSVPFLLRTRQTKRRPLSYGGHKPKKFNQTILKFLSYTKALKEKLKKNWQQSSQLFIKLEDIMTMILGLN